MHIGVWPCDVDVLVRHAQFFGCDLPQYRQRALADFAFTGNDGGATVFVDAHNRRAAVPVAETAAAVDVHAAAHAQTAIGLLVRALVFPFLFPLDQVGRLVDALTQFAAGDLVVMRRDIAILDGVQAQQVDHVHFQFFGGQIPGLFDSPVGRRIAKAAERAGRHQVGVDQRRFGAGVRIFVQRIVAHRGGAENGLRLAGIGAVVGPHADFLGQHLAGLGEAQAHPVAHGHAWMAGEEFFFAGVDQLDRAAGLARENGRDYRAVVIAGLAAETTADFGLDHAHLRFGHAQRYGVTAAGEEGRLRVAPHGHAVTGPVRNAADGLQRGMPLPDRIPGTFDDDVGGLETGIDFAALKRKFVRDIARCIVVHQRRAGRHRFIQRKHRGQRFVLNNNAVDRGARGFRIGGGDGDDFIADITHAADGQRIEIGAERAPFALGGVFAGDHRLDPGHRARGAGVDGQDARVGMRAAQHGGVQHAGHVQVGDILRGASDFRLRIGARHILADDQQAGFELRVAQILVAVAHAFPAFFSSADASR